MQDRERSGVEGLERDFDRANRILGPILRDWTHHTIVSEVSRYTAGNTGCFTESANSPWPHLPPRARSWECAGPDSPSGSCGWILCKSMYILVAKCCPVS